jgi:WD40 repeat protein
MQGRLFSFQFSPDGRWFSAEGVGGAARLWDLRSPDPEGRSTVLHGRQLFSPDGRWLVLVGPNNTVRSAEPMRSSKLGTGLVVVGNNTVRLWDLNSADPAAPPDGLSDFLGRVYFPIPWAIQPGGTCAIEAETVASSLTLN